MVNDPIELAAIDRGAGTPVALVHGGVFHSGPAWAKTLGPLVDAGYRAIAVDRRGHGRSEDGDAEWVPVHVHADDLRLTLELRDAHEVDLVGVSHGALVCLEFALSWPDRARSMVIVEPPLFTWMAGDHDYHDWFTQFFVIDRNRRKGMPLEQWVPAWLGLMDSRMAAEITPDSPAWQMIRRHGPLIFKEEPGWWYEPNEERLDALRTPTLVINGSESEPPMQAIGEMLAERLPAGSHAWIDGAGHDAHARRPEAFNQWLLSFLGKQGP